MNEALLELFFMLVVLKLPIVYLCLVIWWAVRAVPDPLEGVPLRVEPGTPQCPWRRPSGPRGRSPRPRAPRRARVEP